VPAHVDVCDLLSRPISAANLLRQEACEYAGGALVVSPILHPCERSIEQVGARSASLLRLGRVPDEREGEGAVRACARLLCCKQHSLRHVLKSAEMIDDRAEIAVGSLGQCLVRVDRVEQRIVHRQVQPPSDPSLDTLSVEVRSIDGSRRVRELEPAVDFAGFWIAALAVWRARLVTIARVGDGGKLALHGGCQGAVRLVGWRSAAGVDPIFASGVRIVFPVTLRGGMRGALPFFVRLAASVRLRYPAVVEARASLRPPVRVACSPQSSRALAAARLRCLAKNLLAKMAVAIAVNQLVCVGAALAFFCLGIARAHADEGTLV
jgi:hypothetical protein